MTLNIFFTSHGEARLEKQRGGGAAPYRCGGGADGLMQFVLKYSACGEDDVGLAGSVSSIPNVLGQGGLQI